MIQVRRGHEEAGQEKTRQEGAGQEKTVGQEEVVDIDSATIQCSPPSAPAIMRSRPSLTRRRSPIHYATETPTYQPNVDKCFNENTYNAACVAVNSHFSLSLNNQKVVNRLKTIKKRYNTIRNILSQEEFSWNPNTNTIDCEDDDLWKRYVAAHPDARTFRGKQIAMYEEMKIVCGNYQAHSRWARMPGKVNGNPVIECKYEQESASYFSASSEHMNDSDGTETQSSAKEPVYTEMLANNEDEDEPEAQPEGQAAKRTRSSETLQDAMLAIASSIRHLADTIEQNKYTIDTPALLQAVMEIEGLEESKQMYAFEFLNEDPTKARAFMAYNRRLRRIYLFRLFGWWR
ncbi:hypothetical protein H5410_012875 [Solanum commersonii]|uniref:Myb/SANT-like domain-containing protein n=1 Tax=Solanum commersonii TaxID=4109 RepID=A0A9J6ATK4_SOLCO|nr:hypothetical protein H5410_012875 [Solanum commersonii]